MKILTTNGLTKLIQLIKSSFVSSTDIVTTQEVDIDTTVTSGSSNLITSGAVYNYHDSNKLSINVDNLSANGQKVFDGQWVSASYTIATGVSATGVNYSLSSFLPNDNYKYEILLYAQINIGSAYAVGDYRNVEVKSSEITTPISLTAIRKQVSSVVSTISGTSVIPIGTDRILTTSARANDKGEFSLMIRGYRRIGTNS